MFRVASSPTGRVVAGFRAPGRGAWLCAGSVNCLDLALRRGSLARGLRLPATGVTGDQDSLSLLRLALVGSVAPAFGRQDQAGRGEGSLSRGRIGAADRPGGAVGSSSHQPLVPPGSVVLTATRRTGPAASELGRSSDFCVPAIDLLPAPRTRSSVPTDSRWGISITDSHENPKHLRNRGHRLSRCAGEA
ncbi:MAG: YlxR family protein [Acidimicrobiales bacterium]